MIVRALPEAPGLICNAGGTPFDKRKIRLEYERTISEQPQLRMVIELIHQFVDKDCIGGHVRVRVSSVFAICTMQFSRFVPLREKYILRIYFTSINWE